MKHQPGEPPEEQGPLSAVEVGSALGVLQAVQRAVEQNQASHGAVPNHQSLSRLAKSIRLLRRDRTSLLPAELFGEASWDILLSLYVAEREGFRMTVSAVCEESGVPETTALRWIERLRQLELVSKRRHPADGRVCYVEFTSDGLARTEELLIRAYQQLQLR